MQTCACWAPVALGTFTVNVVGGLLMGSLVGFLAHRGGVDQDRWRVLLGVGVLGGFTTFSAFSVEVALMIERGPRPTRPDMSRPPSCSPSPRPLLGLSVSRRLFA